jgi:hypothetical protein
MYLSPDIARIVFWICIACCAVAQLGILWSTSRATRTQAAADNSSEPAAAAGGRRATEFMWALLPAVALVLVFAGTWKAIERVSSTDEPAPAMPLQPAPALTGAASHLASNTEPTVRREPPARSSVQPRPTRVQPAVMMSVPAEQEVVSTVPEFPQQ